MKLYNEFVEKYDSGSLKFDNTNFRKGARITAKFGLDDGFRVDKNGEFAWGYVRIHTGVDRAHGGIVGGVEDVIMAPFDFDSSRFEDYNGKVYGTLVVLVSEKFGFEFRIAHMHPSEILILDKLKNKDPIEKDTIIGPTGTYGLGSGAHTHTEIKSLKENSPVLEMILEERFGSIKKEYSQKEISDFYKSQRKFTDASVETIFTDWEKQKEIRRAFFVNKYLYRFNDFDGTKRTRYSSELLFNGV